MYGATYFFQMVFLITITTLQFKTIVSDLKEYTHFSIKINVDKYLER